MKFVTFCSAVGAGLVASVFALQGCSSDAASPSKATAIGQPVPRPNAGPGDASDVRTFAVDNLYLGDTTRTGTNSKDAWRTYGYNLDGRVTTRSSTDVCARPEGASVDKQEDGQDGRDNSFGHTALELIADAAPNPSKTLSDAIANGSFTLLFTIKGLSDDPKQSATALAGQLAFGGKFGEGKKPTFTPSDDWPYRAEPNIAITDAYINEGTFVSGTAGMDVQLSLSVSGYLLDLTIRHAIITFDHSAPDALTNGTIAGIIPTTEFLDSLTKVAGSISESFCSGDRLENTKTLIRQSSDIRADGTNGPGAECDAISVGLGFTAKRIGPPTTTAPADAPQADKCKETPVPVDAGTDAATEQPDAGDVSDAGDGGD